MKNPPFSTNPLFWRLPQPPECRGGFQRLNAPLVRQIVATGVLVQIRIRALGPDEITGEWSDLIENLVS
jgi:hypothetical protein